MKVVYTSPNRSHHYEYAKALCREGMLGAFVSGFSRYSPRAELPEAGPLLKRHDSWQNLYLAALKLHAPSHIAQRLAFLSKRHLDACSTRYLDDAQALLFYNGAGLQALRKARKAGIVTICEAVNSHILTQSEILRQECRLLGLNYQNEYQAEVEQRISEYQESDYILMPSQFVRDSFLSHGLPRERLIVNPYGMPAPPEISRSRQLPTDGLHILYVGQIHYRKGLRYLVQAFERLRLPRKHLSIVGPILSDSGIADLTLPESVTLHGVLKGQALQDMYQKADVFVQPSIEEGLSLVIGEAMSHGLPTIATCNSGASEIIVHGKSGLLVEARQPVAILEALQQLLEQPDLYAAISQCAISQVKQLGGWDSSGQRLTARIKAILARN